MGECPPVVRAAAKWIIDFAKAYNLSKREVKEKLRQSGIPEECWRDLVEMAYA